MVKETIEALSAGQWTAAGVNIALVVAVAVNTMTTRDLKDRMVRIENHVMGDTGKHGKAKAASAGR